MSLGIFESLAADDSDERVALRKATAVATKRVNDRFGAFLAAAETPQEHSARLELVRGDIKNVVASACNEYGGDPKVIETSILSHLATKESNAKVSFDPPVPGVEGPDVGPSPELGPEPELGPDLGPPVEDAPQCANCGAVTDAGDRFCANCGAELGDTVPVFDPNDPEAREPVPPSDLFTASTRTARRPKMCPYHREVTDISLASGDPAAGFNAMSQHAWGAQHCQGQFEGKCNWKREMVTQEYWDQKAQQAQERREQRERERQIEQEVQNTQVPESPEGLDSTEPAADPTDGGPSIMEELADAPSAIGAPEAETSMLEPMAASVQKQACPHCDGDLGDDADQYTICPHCGLKVDDKVDIGRDSEGNEEWDKTSKAAEAAAQRLAALQKRALDLSPQEIKRVRDALTEYAARGGPADEELLAIIDRLDTEVGYDEGELPRPGVSPEEFDAEFGRGASARFAEALKTVDITKGKPTDPSPEMNKTRWKPNALYPNGNLPETPEGIEMNGSPNPTERVDILEPIEADRDGDFLEGTRAVTETQDVTQDSSFDGNKADSGSWAGNNGTTPVTSAKVDPYVNPIQQIVEEEFVSPSQVEAAIKEYEENA